MLVDNELWEGSPYRAVLRKIANEVDAPLVDSLAIVNAARTNIEESLEAQLNLAGRDNPLPPPPAGKTTVVFRVYQGSVEVPKTLLGPAHVHRRLQRQRKCDGRDHFTS